MNKLPGIQFIFSGLLIIFLAICPLLGSYSILPVGFYLLLIVLGATLLTTGIHLWTRRSGKPNGILIWALTGLMAAYAVTEITMNIRAVVGHLPPPASSPDLGFGAFNGPCAEYDTVRGYRWTNPEIRMFKMVNRELVYDNIFRINAQGYFFPRDYTPKRKREGAKRYLVLGDSFSSAEYLRVPWTVRADSLLGQDPEIYSFSVDGGGLYNWHRIFFKEIVPVYEFDGIVLAVFGNDLEREFFVMHHMEDTGYTGYLPEVPSGKEELIQNFADALMPYAGYLPDSVMDALIDRNPETEPRQLPDVYALKTLMAAPANLFTNMRFKRFLSGMLVPAGNPVSVEEARTGLGPARYERVMDIIDYCQRHGKDVVIATLPYQPALPYAARGKILRYYAYCQTIARTRDTGYFDGTSGFLSLSSQEQKLCFLPYDIHWSQQGSDYFAEQFAGFLRNRVNSGTGTAQDRPVGSRALD